ncbi:MAG: hypothetical protein DRO92_02000, partial [Candidatus Altiarchaeales archaeon]
STNIDYHIGQFNLCKVTIVTGFYYQTKITNTKTLYWKVCAIDSALKHSAYCAEQMASPPTPVHNLTKAQDYPTIQSAINDASNGNLIQVDAGVYNEGIVISGLTNLILEATSWASNGVNTNTIIDGGGAENVISLSNCQNCVIRGFSITGATNGIYIIGSSASNRIVHNVIYSNESYGIYINSEDADNNYIMTNEMYGGNQDFGIYIWDADYTTIESNKLHNNKFSGVIVRGNAVSNYIINNQMYDNPDYGINVIDATVSHLIIKGNKIWGFIGETGIRIQDADNFTIKSNIIHSIGSGTTPVGIYIGGNAEGHLIEYNTIYSNSRYGIYISGDDADNNYILTNEIYGGGQNRGVYITNGDRNVIKGNEIYDNAWQGIELGGSAVSNRIEGNIIYNQNQNIYLYGNSVESAVISNNSLYGSGVKSLYVNSGKSHKIVANYITNNTGGNSIYVINATNIEISHNIIGNQSSVTGIWIGNSIVKLELNSITNNAVGVYIGTGGEITNVKNNIYNNTTLNLETLKPCNLTNNWWGDTVLSSITNTITGISVSNIVPYRLFGPYDITEGADTTPPSVVTSLTANVVNGTNVVLQWSSSSGAVRYFIYRTNTDSWSNLTKANVVGISTGTNWTNYGVSGGWWYYWVTALDNPGTQYTNESWYSASATAYVDRTAPSSVSLLLPVSNTLTNNNNINFLWHTSTDTGTGVTNYILQISTNNFVTTNIEKILTPTNFSTNIYEGTNWWRVYAKDRAGNVSTISQVWTVIVDTVPPGITLTFPASNSTSGNTSVTFQWGVSDENGIASQRIEIDTNNDTNNFEVVIYTQSPYTYTFSGNGTNHWRVWAIDYAGNTNYSGIWTIIVDTNTPIATLYRPVNVYTNTNAPEFVWSDTSSKGTTSNVIQIATNTAFSPIVRSNSGGASFTNWAVSPALGTDKYWWRVLTYKASTSTWYTSAVAWVWVDTNKPAAVSLINPTNNAIFSNTIINFEWNAGIDIGTGITNYGLYITNTGSGWKTNIIHTGTNINVNIPIDGIYNWRVRSYDKAGNYSESIVYQFNRDTTPPVSPVLISPVNNKLTNNTTINFVWSSVTDTSGIMNYRLEITNYAGWGTNIVTTQTDYIVTIHTGTNYWNVIAQDNAGNCGSAGATNIIIVDITPPVVTLISPASNSFYTTSVITFQWNATDENGITNSRLEITNYTALWGTNIQTELNSVTVSNVRTGTNYWKVLAKDKAGNTNYSVVWTVVVDTNKPAVPIWVSATAVSTNQIDLVWYDVSNETNYELYRNINNDTNTAVLIATLSADITNYSDTGLAPATMYYYWLKAYNIVGSSGFSAVISNKTLTPPPPIEVTNLISTVLSSNIIALNWEDKSDETGYIVYTNSVNNTNTAGVIGVVNQNITNYNAIVVPNSLYYFWVKATNIYGHSGFGNVASNISYAIAPKIVCNRAVNTVYTNGVFIFTNKAPVGAGGISGYRYVWDMNPSVSVTNTDTQWIPAGVGDVLTNTATGEGNWYLHIRSYNLAGVLMYQKDYGPYKYYTEYPGEFKLILSKPRIEPDGIDYTEIRNELTITNKYTGLQISDGNIFYIEVIEGVCNIEAGITNGKYYVMSTNGNIRFKIRGNVINNVRIRVYWIGDYNVGDEINVLISPAMDIADKQDAIVYNTIINPDKGERLEIYINSDDGEDIELHI